MTRLLMAMARFLSAGFLSSNFLLLDLHPKSRSVCVPKVVTERTARRSGEKIEVTV